MLNLVGLASISSPANEEIGFLPNSRRFSVLALCEESKTSEETITTTIEYSWIHFIHLFWGNYSGRIIHIYTLGPAKTYQMGLS